VIPIIKNNQNAITKICQKYRVSELFIFGSATNKTYSPLGSDIDLAVRFELTIAVEDMADHYFGLIEELEYLLNSSIDLVTLQSLKNSIFKQELEKTMIPLYSA
jgi:hypothetical protein